MLPMQPAREQPVHWDQHRSNFNLTLIFALAVAVLGLFSQNFLLVAVGIAMAAYSWLTTPRQYLIYRDALVIVYGQPRSKPIPFAEISHLETLALPMGERLRIRMITGKREMLAAKDPDTFRSRLDEALNRYNGDQQGPEYVEGRTGFAREAEDYGSLGATPDDMPPAATQDSSTMEDLSSAPPPFDAESGLSSDVTQREDPKEPKSPY